ncbi:MULTISPECIES: AMP-binding protein [Streptomyces]|uniref:AMP-binding protein n=1 Tax=Streptomyces scabiei TaxID=1930 RepID=UPI00076604C9|nr:MULTISPECIES: AMP-binding protein [Streptomyces]MBP5872859.1 AMP-binding protein [Streptomyces sp. LBUM 1485]MBP5933992.1 AMP-binding protein [Streptomyces sp. LBUM 1479]MBP5911168.1 AMP-binding protein [Streptomyces sp. LBUM 1486]MDX3031074.1 AMP-binding protein [Streptomyces scabiei]MDX3208686.1 AMP-binding protein [Streptomyces scabiei]
MTLSPSGHLDTFARDHLPGAGDWPVLEFTTDQLRYPERLNAAVELIDRPTAALGPDRPALRTPDGEVWSYGELRRRSAQIAEVLTEDLGLVPGNRVLLRSPNTPWAVAAWLGVLRAGGIAVAVMTALRARELAPIVTKTRPAVALVDHRFLDEVLAVRDTVAPELTVVPCGGAGADDLSVLAGRKPGRFAAVDTAADDVALFGPTSGTTGVPKITTHFHRDLLSIDNTFGRNTLGLRSEDLVACTAPLAFTFGLGMLVVFTLRAGACAFLTEPVPPPRLADLVAEHGVSVLATAPTAYRQILNAGKVSRLAGLRRAVSAGEHIPQGLWEELRDRLGIRVIDGIGATEMLHIFISAAGDDIRPGATGRPVPGYRAAILGPDGEELGPGTEGLLGVIGPVGCRYLNDERQAGYVVNGWNITGDTFLRDEDGYFWYRARNDSLIVSSGYNIAGPEVEAAIDTHPDVVEAAVVGAPDAERGAIVCAFVVLRDGVAGDAVRAKDIQDHVKQQIAPYKYPREVRFVEALPRNPSGKLQHFKLRRLLEERA